MTHDHASDTRDTGLGLRVAGAALCAAAMLSGGPELSAGEPGFTITQPAADGVYKTGEVITWTVTPHGFAALPPGSVTYVVQRGGYTTIAEAALDVSAGSGTITTKLDAPGTVLATITAKPPGAKSITAFAGAVAEPTRIKPSMPRPDDFDAFWKGKLAALAAVPMNPVLEAKPAPNPQVDYWHITMDNIAGSRIRGQLARPKAPGPRPAMLIVRWAGVYALDPSMAGWPAAQGFLTLDISAHDLPVDQPPAYYQELEKTTLKNYTSIGNQDRETSYYLRMFLSASRAVDYLAQRPDWDGKTLLVTGASQGGWQAIVAAALNHKVTAVIADVPAGCDHTGPVIGRAPGWPNWISSPTDQARIQASRYYDTVNFASGVICPTLIGLGLLDVAARPEGILAAANQIKGPVETVIMPMADHQGGHGPLNARIDAWKAALVQGKPVK